MTRPVDTRKSLFTCHALQADDHARKSMPNASIACELLLHHKADYWIIENNNIKELDPV